MSRGERTFKRPVGTRRYRKMFVIAIEGSKTESQYFDILHKLHDQSVVHLKYLQDKHKTSPSEVLKRMIQYLHQKELETSDEAWLVVDKDEWTDEELRQLYEWSQKKDNYGFALSNPKFEYWLLLHFEDGAGVGDSRECSNRLKQHIFNYNKNIPPHKITRLMIDDAIRRAKAIDTPCCTDWPRKTGTTVYKLIEKILTA